MVTAMSTKTLSHPKIGNAIRAHLWSHIWPHSHVTIIVAIHSRTFARSGFDHLGYTILEICFHCCCLCSCKFPSSHCSINIFGLCRRIAENMAAAKRHIPHFTYVDEVDVTALEAMRADLNAHRGPRPKLTMLPLLIVAICRTLPQFPMLNARYDDEAGVVTRSGRVHLGMAAQTDAGLTVPVIRDAGDLNIAGLARRIADVAHHAPRGVQHVQGAQEIDVEHAAEIREGLAAE